MEISQYISTFGVIIVALFLVWKEYRSGNTGLNSQVIANYTALDKQQKEKIAERDAAILQYQKDMAQIKSDMGKMKEDFAKQMGILQGQITAKDQHISDLQNTILNRNPELEDLLKEIRDFMENIHTLNTHQTDILEAGVVREKKIDKATDEEEGHLLRKPETK